jgi:hypothetical protein
LKDATVVDEDRELDVVEDVVDAMVVVFVVVVVRLHPYIDTSIDRGFPTVFLLVKTLRLSLV